MNSRVLTPHAERLLDAESYLKEMHDKSHNIASVEFIPPSIGGHGYGRFRVRYKKPILLSDGA